MSVYLLRLWYKMPWVVPEKFVVPDELTGRTRIYRLGKWGRLFMTLDGNFSGSRLSFLWGLCIQCINIISPIINILVTTPAFQYQPTTCDKPACDNHPDLCPGFQMCQPQGNKLLIAVDDILLIVVAAEHIIRVMICWSVPLRLNGLLAHNFDEEMKEKYAKLSPDEQLLKIRDPSLPARTVIVKYLLMPQNILNKALLLPLYISLLPNTWSHDKTGFVRAFRLLRVIQVMKISSLTMSTTAVLRKAIAESLPSVGVITVLFIIILVLFGSLLYHAEKGNFVVNGDFPTGEYLTRSLTPGSFQVAYFRSIAEGIYFSGITLATVGYGDLFPVSPAGRFLASVMAFIGSLVLAIPTAVLGNNFTANYKKYVIGHVLKDQEIVALEKHKMKRNRLLTRKKGKSRFQLFTNALTTSSTDKKSTAVSAAAGDSSEDATESAGVVEDDRHGYFGQRRFRAFCLMYLRLVGASTSFADDAVHSLLDLLQLASVNTGESAADALLEAQADLDWDDYCDANSVESEVDDADYDDKDGDYTHNKKKAVDDAKKALGIADTMINRDHTGVESNYSIDTFPTDNRMKKETSSRGSTEDVQLLATLQTTLALSNQKSTKNYLRLVDECNKTIDMVSKTTDHIGNKLRKY